MTQFKTHRNAAGRLLVFLNLIPKTRKLTHCLPELFDLPRKTESEKAGSAEVVLVELRKCYEELVEDIVTSVDLKSETKVVLTSGLAPLSRLITPDSLSDAFPIIPEDQISLLSVCATLLPVDNTAAPNATDDLRQLVGSRISARTDERV